MADEVTKYDGWLGAEESVAALVLREYLMPIEGADGVVFPATFAAAEDKTKFGGGYNIDTFPDGKSVCLIDSVGSQSNRIEPIFAAPNYVALVPQIVVKAGEKQINLLEAGHRAGDALVRCSALQKELQDAFKAVQKGDAEPLAKIAPTSLVFGVWDSRDTQAKLPRLIASTIRAFDVKPLTRSATYLVQQQIDYVKDGIIPEWESKTEKDKYSEKGFLNALASATHGGVIATGGIRRDATLSLAALRLLRVGKDQAKTLALRRYIFGLALTAFTHPPASYLRQGCNLVADPDKPREFVEVHIDGKRVSAKITHADALAFATAAAKAFGVGKDRTVDFDTKLASRDVRGDAENGDADKPKKANRK